MKIAIINGSPKGKNSNSSYLVNNIKKCISENTDKSNVEGKNNTNVSIYEFIWNHNSCPHNDFETILQCDSIVFCFPLYIDSIPSHLLRILIDFENYVIEIKKTKYLFLAEINIYVVINNGFYDGKQNHLAIDNIKHWCRHIGFIMAQGIGIGGGGMLPDIKDIPLGHGPKKTIGIELKAMCNNIILRQSGKVTFIEPNFPSLSYKFLVERRWRKIAKTNNLKAKDLNKRLTTTV